MEYALWRAIDMAFVEVVKFYRDESRKDKERAGRQKRKDISVFFKDTPDLSGKFRRFWGRSASPTKRARFAARLKEIRDALADWK